MDDITYSLTESCAFTKECGFLKYLLSFTGFASANRFSKGSISRFRKILREFILKQRTKENGFCVAVQMFRGGNKNKNNNTTLHFFLFILRFIVIQYIHRRQYDILSDLQ